MRTIASLLLFILFSSTAFAQDAPEAGGFLKDPISDPMFPFYLLAGFVFLTAFLVIVVAVYMLKVLNVFIEKAAAEKAEKLGVKYEPEPGWFSKFWAQINAFKPVEKEADLMLDHDYDGIKELDNHLPPWWKWLLYGSFVWGAGYLIVYHITGSLPLQEEEYQTEVAIAAEQKARLLATNPPLTIDENTLVYTQDEQIISNGRKVFVTNCVSCHMPEGQGSIGPNLTDEYWLHGGGIKDIYSVIKMGVPEKGMISWQPVLSPEQMRDVAFYIMSLKGTNPPNPKAPQGELYKAEEPVQADSVKSSI